MYTYIHKVYIHTCIYMFTHIFNLSLSGRSFFAKEPLIIRLFCGKWPIKIRHPTTLRHPVLDARLKSALWKINHMWVRNFYVSESCHIYEWVMSQTWARRIARMSESRHAHQIFTDPRSNSALWKLNRMWVSRVTYMSKSCYMYKQAIYMCGVHVAMTSRLLKIIGLFCKRAL